MIKIVKDNDIRTVTNGVYENLYKPLGYTVFVEENKKPEKKVEKVSDIFETVETKKTNSTMGKKSTRRK